MRKRILFVDDEPRVLDGLRRMLHCMAEEWDMTFVESGESAIQALCKQPFDVIVTDMRMPRMNGAQLLREVVRRWPSTVRFILSGYSDQQLILQTVTLAHQYLNKPCDPQRLKAAIARACSLRDKLEDETVRSITARLRSLPALPDLYLKVADELKSPDPSLRKIGEMISEDIGMTAKILQMVNSAFFGLPKRIASPVHAATLLGLDIMKSLMLSVHMFTDVKHERLVGFSPAVLWNHSMKVSGFAKRIAKIEECDETTVDHAIAGGLLHDAGKVVLAANLPEEYAKALEIMRKENKAASEAETQVFGTTHGEIGAYLAALWAFPDPIVEALAFHHNPTEHPAEEMTPLTAVHVADAFEHEFNEGASGGGESRVDLSHIHDIGLADRLPIWKDACQAMIPRGSEHECESTLR
jgi:putative nucleotidyltransferase with HDIG domain